MRFLILLMAALALPVTSPEAQAAGNSGDVTLIHIGDLHGHMVPRPNLRDGDPDKGQMMGGLAYVYGRIQDIRKRHPNSLLVNTGDTIQGSAEALYTSGDAMVQVLNNFGIDAFVPGNWDYLYGTDRFIDLFAGKNPKANWHSLAANLYYSTLYDDPASPYASKAGQRVLPPYLIKQAGKLRIGIISLSAERGPQAVSTHVMDGFTLTTGEFELAAAVPLLRNKHHVDLIVLISERGLAPNIELTNKIPGVDVVLSSDMHEETRREVIGKHGTILVEEGQDGTMVGELTVQVRNGRMVGHTWTAHRITTRNTTPDTKIAKMVAEIRRPFIKEGFVPHSNPINGAVLRTPIDTVIGYTKVGLHRSNFTSARQFNAVIEGTSHDFLSDAFRYACNSDLGVIRGFRYGTHVAPGPIRLEDIYHYIPIGPQVACGLVSGDEVRWDIERGIDYSLSKYIGGWWGGGWLLAFSGITYDLDLKNEFGFRVKNLRVNGEPIDMEKMYSIGGYWYVDNPNLINRHKALEIKVLKGPDKEIIDATDVVANYLMALPDHTVENITPRIRLLSPLPKPVTQNGEIQPWEGLRDHPDY